MSFSGETSKRPKVMYDAVKNRYFVPDEYEGIQRHIIKEMLNGIDLVKLGQVEEIRPLTVNRDTTEGRVIDKVARAVVHDSLPKLLHGLKINEKHFFETLQDIPVPFDEPREPVPSALIHMIDETILAEMGGHNPFEIRRYVVDWVYVEEKQKHMAGNVIFLAQRPLNYLEPAEAADQQPDVIGTPLSIPGNLPSLYSYLSDRV